MRRNKQLIKLTNQIVEQTSVYQSLEKEVMLKEFELERMRGVLRDQDIKKHHLLTETSLLIVNLNNAHERGEEDPQEDQVGIEQIFVDGAEGEEQERRVRMRATVQEVLHIVRFIYTTDNLTDFTEEDLRRIENYIGQDN